MTYGTFRSDDEGHEYGSSEVIERDFALMTANGINTIRTYTVPPRWVLDLAQRYGLYVMVGLPWEQHVAFLDDKQRASIIEQRVRAGVRACKGHPALLCFVIGNEIPASIVRWHGRNRVERFLRRLYEAAKSEDPDSLVTYVNFPTTEYLELPFLDFVCFNVFLESQQSLDAYLARLQNIAGDRALVLAEVGLDSRRNGEQGQASSLEWQIQTAFSAGCAGLMVFAWTDEWHRGGHDIEDWDFGLTTRERAPKPALGAVRKAFAQVPFPDVREWPRISVVVCTHNGHRTLAECLEHLQKLEYPDYEVIVVDDGSSSDAVGDIVRRHDVRLISVQNGGLSKARNIGMQAATGEIVAYIDDDAYPDSHWLTYLAHTFMTTGYAAVGGPNVPPPGDGRIADCVAHSPGGPTHVLLSDREAEHIPGCNMAFRRAHLLAIGGFDRQFHVAGDDVDVCWRLQQQGWKLGYSPAAVVWHHARGSIRTYWKQQAGYGRAEALLEAKWPEKYNIAGHPTWAGRVYGNGFARSLGSLKRVYHGVWGSAPFQSLYERTPGSLGSLAFMPEWYLVLSVLVVLSALGLMWKPLLTAAPILVVAAGTTLLQAVVSAVLSRASGPLRSRSEGAWQLPLTAFLHLLQPMARLRGRLLHGITPWRRRGVSGASSPRPRTLTVWSEYWRSPSQWLESIERSLRANGSVIFRGNQHDRWELEARGGLLGAARLRMGLEEHGAGRQLARFRVWPKVSSLGIVLTTVFACLALWAAMDAAWVTAGTLGCLCLSLGLSAGLGCGVGMKSILAALASEEAKDQEILSPLGDKSPLKQAAAAAASGPQFAVVASGRAPHSAPQATFPAPLARLHNKGPGSEKLSRLLQGGDAGRSGPVG